MDFNVGFGSCCCRTLGCWGGLLQLSHPTLFRISLLLTGYQLAWVAVVRVADLDRVPDLHEADPLTHSH